MESGRKLRLAPVAVSAACVLYHRFYQNCSQDEVDPILAGTTALYLASKCEETPCKLRDVINVCYRTANSDRQPLEVGLKFWQLRESVVNCELLMLRVLGFRVAFDNPHKYLLHYLKSLQDWVGPSMLGHSQVAQLSWSVLQDTFHTPLCLMHQPSQIAVAVLYTALLCSGFVVPPQHRTATQKQWWQVFWPECKEADIQDITHQLLELYNKENRKKF